MKHIRKVELDIDREYFEKIPAVQYDNNSRYLQITLMSGVGPLDITGHTVIVSGYKPDGTEIFNSCRVVDAKKGVIEVHLSEQVSACEGVVDANIQVYGDDNSLLSTQQFHVYVAKGFSGKTVESSNEFKGLVDALGTVQKMDNRITEANSKIIDLGTTKLDKTGSITVAQIDKNQGKFDQTYMSEELLRQIAGNASINAVPADKSITAIKYADKSIQNNALADKSVALINLDNELSKTLISKADSIDAMTAEVKPVIMDAEHIDCDGTHLFVTITGKQPSSGTMESPALPDALGAYSFKLYSSENEYKDHEINLGTTYAFGIGSVADVVDVTTGSITRNIRQKKFTGDEKLTTLSAWSDANYVAFYYVFSQHGEENTPNGASNYMCNALPRLSNASDAKEGIYRGAETGSGITVGMIIKVARTRVTSGKEVESFKQLLSTMYSNGKPFTLYRQVGPKVESIEPQFIATNRDYFRVVPAMEYSNISLKYKARIMEDKIIQDLTNKMDAMPKYVVDSKVSTFPIKANADGLAKVKLFGHNLAEFPIYFKSPNLHSSSDPSTKVSDGVNKYVLDSRTIQLSGVTTQGNEYTTFEYKVEKNTKYHIKFNATLLDPSLKSGGASVFNGNGDRIDTGNDHTLPSIDCIVNTGDSDILKVHIYFRFGGGPSGLNQVVTIENFHIIKSPEKVKYCIGGTYKYVVPKFEGSHSTNYVSVGPDTLIESLKCPSNLLCKLEIYDSSVESFRSINNTPIKVTQGDLEITPEDIGAVALGYVKVSDSLPYTTEIQEYATACVEVNTFHNKSTIKAKNHNMFDAKVNYLSKSGHIVNHSFSNSGSCVEVESVGSFASWYSSYIEFLYTGLIPGEPYTLKAFKEKLGGYLPDERCGSIVVYRREDTSSIVQHHGDGWGTLKFNAPDTGNIKIRLYPLTSVGNTDPSRAIKCKFSEITLYSGEVDLPAAKKIDIEIPITKQGRYKFEVSPNTAITVADAIYNDCTVLIQKSGAGITSINGVKPNEFGEVNIPVPKSIHHNKKYVAFGDSITGNPTIGEDYPTFVGNLLGVVPFNAGFGGCRWGEHSPNSWDAFGMYRLSDSIKTGDWSYQFNSYQQGNHPSYFKPRAEEMSKINWKEIELITIAYGTNDWGNHINRMDNPNDPFDVTHFKGAVRYSLRNLMETCPQAKIGIITPMYRFFPSEEGKPDTETYTRNGMYLIEYVDALIEVADEFRIPVLDNYRKLGLNKYNRSHWFTEPDGTHPNLEGRQLLASRLSGFIQSEM